MAAVMIGSWNISSHLSNDKFVVIIVDFLPARRERFVNSSPHLPCQTIYTPIHQESQGHTLKSVFKISQGFLRFCFLKQGNKKWNCSKPHFVTFKAGLDAKAYGHMGFTCTGLPARITFCPSLTKSSVFKSFSFLRASSGRSSTTSSSKYFCKEILPFDSLLSILSYLMSHSFCKRQ